MTPQMARIRSRCCGAPVHVVEIYATHPIGIAYITANGEWLVLGCSKCDVILGLTDRYMLEADEADEHTETLDIMRK